ncbi:hypothetical protein CRYPA_1688 [uncultured Candidatus Thioglobus sp.]|nr:hypothetical protein CRYPA_1688 [uncultured Candidatus Thioglobus sp.]
MKIKLFYSYTREDETDRDELEKHLTTLKNNGLIDEWHDRKINAGDKWEEKISEEMDKANIILLLFSTSFIASPSCQKEVEKTLTLKKEKGTAFIPIILKKCAWKDVEGMSEIQALPKDAEAISLWGNKDEAWSNVYEKIKEKVEKLRNEIKPTLKNNFKNILLDNPASDCPLDKIFVYPDILEVDKSEQKLEQNEVDAEKLCDIKFFKHKYILISGKEQIGKTSLCNMLYLTYIDKGLFPVLINGNKIFGKAIIGDIIEEAYQEQYECTNEYWDINKTNRVLIIDDINNRTANDSNYSTFLQSVKENFLYSIVLIDDLINLAGKSTEHNYFYLFSGYSIKSFGHKKRSDLIKKCIENNENSQFDINNIEQVARLDKDTKHIDTIIQSNIVPSYPIIIISSFNIIETATPQDTKETSYGHCYHAMITTQLYRVRIKPDSMNEYFNFLSGLAYFMFNNETKNASKDDLEKFKEGYKSKHILNDNEIIKKLINAHILVVKNEVYSFQYIYIYYYFVAKYIADNFASKKVKAQFRGIISRIHKKDDFNIATFSIHHAAGDALDILLENITLNAMGTFEKYSEATLDKKETKFLIDAIKNKELKLPRKQHNVTNHRNQQLEQKDNLQPTIDRQEEIIEDNEDNLDSLTIEILKSAKSMDLIGQIMKNQYGTFKKDKLKELFEEGQNVGLRLLKSFIDLISKYPDGLKNLIEERLTEIEQESNQSFSQERKQKISNRFLYDVIFGWLYKIVDSLGYDKLISISDDVNVNIDTTASKLINFSIHAWHKKNLDIDKLKSLYQSFDKDRNHVAQYILKDIVSRHVYMHKIGYQKKQKIESLLEFSTQNQISIQSKLN